jgi:hypothetical protein
VVAYPLRALRLRVHERGEVHDETITCGVAYRDSNLTLPAGNLRVNQSGQTYELYSPAQKIVVCEGPLGELNALLARVRGTRSSWYSWRGTLSKGQLIVLVDDPAGKDSRGVSASGSIGTVIEVLEITSAGGRPGR